MSPRTIGGGALAAGLLAAMLSGCTYDYLQHSDRIGYRAGDAVKANVERETTDPSPPLIYNTTGLGKNGSVQPVDTSNDNSDPNKAGSAGAAGCATTGATSGGAASCTGGKS